MINPITFEEEIDFELKEKLDKALSDAYHYAFANGSISHEIRSNLDALYVEVHNEVSNNLDAPIELNQYLKHLEYLKFNHNFSKESIREMYVEFKQLARA